mgnify:CR=1 FL=1
MVGGRTSMAERSVIRSSYGRQLDGNKEDASNQIRRNIMAKLFPGTVFVFRHREGSDEWLEVSEDPKTLDLPDRGKQRIAVYFLDRVTEVEWRLDVKD